MATSVNWATGVITVNQADLTLITGTLYELDTDQFRLGLKALEASEEGVVWPFTHIHNTQVTVAGTTFFRTVEIISPYSIQFLPDSQWSVRLVGSNNNIFDVENGILIQNQVQVIPNNSGGGIVVETGTSGLTPTESAQLASVPVIETDVASIETDIGTINTNIGTINTNVGTMQTDISSITTDVAILAGNVSFPKNTAFANFTFTMNSVTGQPVTGLSITGERSLDGASYAALANAISEIDATGTYKVDLAASDLNADTVTLRFTATGAIERVVTIATV